MLRRTDRIRDRRRLWYAVLIIGLAWYAPSAIADDAADDSETVQLPRFAGQVIILSLDGLRPDAIDAAPAPTLQRLIQGGAYDRRCLNELPTATLPNHASIVTGLSVRDHRVILNFDLPGSIPSETIFEVAHTAGLRTAFFASKSKLGFLCRPESVDVRVLEHDLNRLTDDIVETFRNAPPDLTFIHFGQPDGNGHSAGWMSRDYLNAVVWVDELTARIDATLTELGINDNTLWIITADHGGQGTNHIFNTPLEREIPFILHGPRVIAGARPTAVMASKMAAPIAARALGLPLKRTWFQLLPADGFAPALAVDRVEAATVESTPAAPPDRKDNTPPVGPACVTYPLFVIGIGVWLVWLGKRGPGGGG